MDEAETYTKKYWTVYSNIHPTPNSLSLNLKEPETQKIHGIVKGYLWEWGGMGRVFGKMDWEHLRSQVINKIIENEKEFKELCGSDFFQLSKNGKNSLVVLYESFLEMKIKSKKPNRQLRFGPTAAGKLLHIILPKICIIWDEEKVRRKDRYDYGEVGIEYLRYLSDRWQVLDKESLWPESGIVNREVAIAEIEKAHHEYLKDIGDINEPVSKLLDEANYPEIE